MFGIGSFPGYGVTGAGIGTFLAALVGGDLSLPARESIRVPDFTGARSGGTSGCCCGCWCRPAPQQFLRHPRVDAHVPHRGARRHRRGPRPTASWSTSSAWWGIPGWGLGLAGATLVGQSMGRPQDGAGQSMGLGTSSRWGTVAMAFARAAVPAGAGPDPRGLHQGGRTRSRAPGCRVRSLGLLTAVNGPRLPVRQHAERGRGDVKRVMYVNLTTQYLVLLPGRVPVRRVLRVRAARHLDRAPGGSSGR